MCRGPYLVRHVIKGMFLPRVSFMDLALPTLYERGVPSSFCNLALWADYYDSLT